MNRKEPGQYKYRKRSAFKPIMLTSKQIKPIERSTLSKIRCQKKFSCNRSRYNGDEGEENYRRNSYIAHSNSAHRIQIIKRLTQQYRDSLIRKVQLKQDNENSNNRSMPAHIVKVQFEQSDSGPFIHSRYDEILDFESCENKHLQKFLYFTNAKTYDSFTRPGKIKFQGNKYGFAMKNKKKENHKTNQKQQSWDNLMKSHYLNVKKVSPVNKIENKMFVSAEKMEEISKKVQEYHNNLVKKFDERFRSTTVMLNRKTPQKQPITTAFTSELPLTEQNKIQEDIFSKRQSPNKKEYFVFGMSETSGKSNGEAHNKAKFEVYKDFLWKINFTNGLYVKVKDQIEGCFKMFVGQGNNSMLIRGIARRRPWWQITDKWSEDTNFVWSQLKINEFFYYQKPHEEKKKIFTVKNRKIHSSLQTSEIRKNLKKEDKSIEREDTIELVQNDLNNNIMLGKDYELWLRHYKLNKKYEDRFENHLAKRVKTLVRKKNLIFIPDSSKLKMQNHFQRNYFLGNKKALFYSMKKYYELHNKDPFEFIPTTFHISKGVDDPEYAKFLQLYYALDEKKRKKQLMNIWILKPGEYTNRGKGITVCSSLDEIKIRLKGKEKCRNGKYHTFILQKYIEKPLLYNKRKFDIRHFMLMTCVNGKFKGYWYSEGYIRTSSYDYNIKNCKDLFTHLTNDSIQKNSQDYGKYEKGNKISYGDFQKYLNHLKKNRFDEEKYDMQRNLLPQMKEIAKNTLQANYMLLEPKRFQHNFQLFGLDFMLDEDLNVSLIEVNTNPCLQISCPLLSKVVPNLIQNVFKICIDPIFPPPFEWPPQKKYQLGENAMEQNKFSLFFDESIEGQRLKKLYEKVELNKGIGDIEEEDEEYEDEGKQWVED